MESRLWLEFCSDHPNIRVAQACSEIVSPPKFWSLVDLYPDFVSRLHIQVRLMGNLCLNGGIPWLFRTEGSLCFICNKMPNSALVGRAHWEGQQQQQEQVKALLNCPALLPPKVL